MPDTNAPTERPSQLRLASRALLLALFVAVAFAVNYFGALHAPHPHDVKIAIVGPPAVTAGLARELSVTPPNGFEVSQLTSIATARRLVADRKLAGAFVPSTVRPTAIVASAASASLASFLEGAFTRVAGAEGRPLAIADVRPLPPDNATGTANFFFLVICSLGGLLSVAALGLVAPALPEVQRLGLMAAASVLTPTVAYLIGGLGFGAFGGDFATIIEMLGLGALYTFAVAGTTRLFQLAFGMAGMVPASLVVLFVSLPSSGGAVAPQLMPGLWRFLNHFWISADGLDANRSILYFGGAGVGDDVLKMLAWIAGWAAVLAVPIYLRSTHRLSRHRSQLRGAAPRPAVEA